MKNEGLELQILEGAAQTVSDSYFEHLQKIGVSYVFGGKNDIDLAKVVDTLSRELHIERFIVEGGAHVSGAFVQAGLVDEVSVIIFPLVYGRGNHPASFEFQDGDWKPSYLRLLAVEKLRDDAVWLRYATKPQAG